jgi:Uma2 family endonuclease
MRQFNKLLGDSGAFRGYPTNGPIVMVISEQLAMKQPKQEAEELVTVREFFQLIPDGQKADLIDGAIYMASPDSRRSNSLTRFLVTLLDGYNGAKQLGGEVFVNRFAFRLSKVRAPEPDVSYVRPERVHLLRKMGMKGGPDVGIEIVSRDSRTRDYGEKKQLYQKARVEEYWIIDPLQQRAEFHRLRNKRYELVLLENNHIFRSQVIPGFWLDVGWLLAKPLPNSYLCLQEILR